MDEPVVTEAAATPKGWLEYLPTLTSVRDTILVVAGIDFVLGYLTIAWAAYLNKLGFIPPLQAQCILAGLMPTILVGIAYLVWVKWQGLIEHIAEWMDMPTKAAHSKARRDFIYYVAICAPLLLSGLMIANNSHHLSKVIHQIATGLLLFLWCVCLTALNTRSLQSLRGIRSTQSLREIYGPESSILNSDELSSLDEALRKSYEAINNIKKSDGLYQRLQLLMYLLWFIFTIPGAWLSMFQSLPQEFGGMEPRFAYVDVKKESLSPETRALLLPAPATEAVCRSQLLDVYYENDGTLFVRPHHATTQTPVQEVKKEAIEGITWCGYDEQRLAHLSPPETALIPSPRPAPGH